VIGYDDLARAASDNDSRIGEGIEISAVLMSLDFDPADILSAANQRALRSILIQRGPSEINRIKDQIHGKRFVVEQLTESEEKLLILLSSVWIDGLLVTAQAIRSQDE
jgi:hypothetical protein